MVQGESSFTPDLPCPSCRGRGTKRLSSRRGLALAGLTASPENGSTDDAMGERVACPDCIGSGTVAA